jgi:hypothetical protein
MVLKLWHWGAAALFLPVPVLGCEGALPQTSVHLHPPVPLKPA